MTANNTALWNAIAPYSELAEYFASTTKHLGLQICVITANATNVIFNLLQLTSMIAFFFNFSYYRTTTNGTLKETAPIDIYCIDVCINQ